MSNIPIFIPHMGCKNDCAFCNQRSITGSSLPTGVDDARRIIEENLNTLKGSGHKIAFFGGSFTGIDRTDMINYLKLAHEYVKDGMVDGIRLSTRPDYISGEIIDILKEYSVTNVELGAQSLDDEVLQLSRRGHDAECVERAAQLIVGRNITLGLQMMVGLPGDTYKKSVKTAEKFVELGAEETRIYPTVVIRGTHLEKMLNDGEYVPMSFDEAIDTAATCYSIFFENNIKVLRIGLQCSEDLKRNAVGGYYHDAIGEIVYSRVIRSKMTCGGEISYNKHFLSKVLGQGRENIKYFEDNDIKYTLKEDNSLSGVKVNGKYVLTF